MSYIKKISAVLFAMFLVFVGGAAPVTALASDVTCQANDADHVHVNGQILENGYYITGNETPSASATEPTGTIYAWYQNGTLVLNNFVVTDSLANEFYMIYSHADLVVELKGANTITGNNNGQGIYAMGELTVKGNGELTVEQINGGFSAGWGDLAIDGGTIQITANNTGLYAGHGDIMISGGTLEVSGKVGINSQMGDGVFISGGTVKATAASDTDSAIYCGTSISITGGTVTAIAKGKNGYGLNSYRVSIENGAVVNIDATQGNGAYAFKHDTKIDGAEVTAKSSGALIQLPVNGFALNGCTAVASANADGSAAVEYNNDNLSTYRYFKTSVPASHTHVGVLKQEVAATTEKPGTKAHYACECGDLFKDAACTVPVTPEELVIQKLPELDDGLGESPNTVDGMSMGLWICVMAAVALAAIGGWSLRKREVLRFKR